MAAADKDISLSTRCGEGASPLPISSPRRRGSEYGHLAPACIGGAVCHFYGYHYL